MGKAALASILALLPSMSLAVTESSLTCLSGSTYVSTKSPTCSAASSNASVHVETTVTEGVMKAWVDSRSDGPPGTYAQGFAILEFADWFTIHAAGREGQTGVATAAAVWQWSASLDVGATFTTVSQATADAGVSLLMPTFPPANGYSWRDQSLRLRHDAFGETFVDDRGAQDAGRDVEFDTPLSATFTFVFGEPIYLYMQLIVASSAGGIASGQMDASHSVYWGGLHDVMAEGAAVEYSVTSDSGVDWSRSMAPVPETSGLALALAGLVLIGPAVRAQKRRRL